MAALSVGPVAVAGATGRQGGAVARTLLAAGTAVRALTRSPHSPAAHALLDAGADVTVCDLGDRVSLRSALDGAAGLFLTTTPYEAGVAEEERQAALAIDGAKTARIPHVVYSSVASADRPTGVAHFESKGRIEKYLRSAHIQFTTVLRPTLFMDMFLKATFRQTLSVGRVEYTMRPETRVSMVATDDIAMFAMHAFADPPAFDGHVIELAGARTSMTEFATALGQGLGREIAYRRVGAAEMPQGVSPKLGTQQWLENAGWQVDPASLHGYGLQLTDVGVWAARHRRQLLSCVQREESGE